MCKQCRSRSDCSFSSLIGVVTVCHLHHLDTFVNCKSKLYKVWDDYNIFGLSNLLGCLRYLQPLNESQTSTNLVWWHVMVIIIHYAVFGDNPVIGFLTNKIICICNHQHTSRKNAYIILTPPPPLKPHFYIVKLGFTGVYIIFLISYQKA